MSVSEVGDDPRREQRNGSVSENTPVTTATATGTAAVPSTPANAASSSTASTSTAPNNNTAATTTTTRSIIPFVERLKSLLRGHTNYSSSSNNSSNSSLNNAQGKHHSKDDGGAPNNTTDIPMSTPTSNTPQQPVYPQLDKVDPKDAEAFASELSATSPLQQRTRLITDLAEFIKAYNFPNILQIWDNIKDILAIQSNETLLSSQQNVKNQQLVLEARHAVWNLTLALIEKYQHSPVVYNDLATRIAVSSHLWAQWGRMEDCHLQRCILQLLTNDFRDCSFFSKTPFIIITHAIRGQMLFYNSHASSATTTTSTANGIENDKTLKTVLLNFAEYVESSRDFDYTNLAGLFDAVVNLINIVGPESNMVNMMLDVYATYIRMEQDRKQDIYVPYDSLMPLTTALCLLVNVEKFCNSSWLIIKNLLQSSSAYPTVHVLCNILLDNNLCQLSTDHLRGAVFFLGMASWGSQRVKSLNYAWSTILTALKASIRYNREIVQYEILLSMNRLIKKYDKDLTPMEWDLLLSMMQDIGIKLFVVSDSRPMSPTSVSVPQTGKVFIPLTNTLHTPIPVGEASTGDVSQTIILFKNLLEHLMDLLTDFPEHFSGDTRSLSNFLIHSKDLISEKRVMSLIRYQERSANHLPLSNNWRRAIVQALQTYYRDEARSSVRLEIVHCVERAWDIGPDVANSETVSSVLDVFKETGLEHDHQVACCLLRLMEKMMMSASSLKPSLCISLIDTIYSYSVPPNCCGINLAKSSVRDDSVVINPHSRLSPQHRPLQPSKSASSSDLFVAPDHHPAIETFSEDFMHTDCQTRISLDILFKLFDRDFDRIVTSPICLQVTKILCNILKSKDVHIQLRLRILTFLLGLRHSNSENFDLRGMIAIYIDILNAERHHQVVLGLLNGLAAQLSDPTIDLTEMQELQDLRGQLCKMIMTDHLVNAVMDMPVTIKKTDIYIKGYEILGSLLQHKDLFNKNQQDEMVLAFQYGLQKWPTTARCCIHYLYLCCLELPKSMTKFLPSTLMKMSQIISNSLLSVHILEFLSALAQLQSLYVNFVENDFKRIFGIALQYIQNANRSNSETHTTGSQIFSHNGLASASSSTDRLNTNNNLTCSEKGTSPANSTPASPYLGATTFQMNSPHFSTTLDLVAQDYVLFLAFRVIAVWFIALPQPHRKRFVGHITRGLLLSHDRNASQLDEKVQCCLDMVSRYAQGDFDPRRPSDNEDINFLLTADSDDQHSKQPLITTRHWLIHNGIITIRTGTTRWAEVVIRRPSGVTSWIGYVANRMQSEIKTTSDNLDANELRPLKSFSSASQELNITNDTSHTQNSQSPLFSGGSMTDRFSEINPSPPSGLGNIMGMQHDHQPGRTFTANEDYDLIMPMLSESLDISHIWQAPLPLSDNIPDSKTSRKASLRSIVDEESPILKTATNKSIISTLLSSQQLAKSQSTMDNSSSDSLRPTRQDSNRDPTKIGDPKLPSCEQQSSANPKQNSVATQFDPGHLFLSLYGYPGFAPCRPLLLGENETINRSLAVLDRIPVIDFHKIGIIYAGLGQTTETEILRNTGGSSLYFDFVKSIGKLLELKGCKDYYTGGLDTESDCDGEYTYLYIDGVTQIVFHVLTLMPNYLETDPSCSTKKRHIGNDFVSIIFDESHLDRPWSLETIPGQYNFIHVVVKPLYSNIHRRRKSKGKELFDELVSSLKDSELNTSEPSESETVPAKATADDTKEKKQFFKVYMIHRHYIPDIGPICREKIVCGVENAASFARQTAIHANTFANIFLNRMQSSQSSNTDREYISNWRERLRQIKRIRDRAIADLKPAAATPGRSASVSQRTESSKTTITSISANDHSSGLSAKDLLPNPSSPVLGGASGSTSIATNTSQTNLNMLNNTDLYPGTEYPPWVYEDVLNFMEYT